MNMQPTPTEQLNAKFERFKNFGLKHLIGIALVIVLVLLILFGFSRWNGTRDSLVSKETGLNAQYQSNQVTLDKFHKKIQEEFGLVGSKTAAVNQVLTDAVEGRYKGALGAATPAQSKAFITAMFEAYPSLDWSNVYDKLQTEISAGRDEFANQQKALLDMIRPYEQYRTQGLIHHMFVNWIGYPALQARIGKETITGKPALRQMELMVTSDEVNKDFTSGTEVPLNLSPTTAG